MLNQLIEGVDYFVRFWDFPNYAANMFCCPNDDGTFTICFNSRFTREQLINDVPHEFVHILKNHFQDDRDEEELENEANELKSFVVVRSGEDAVDVKLEEPHADDSVPKIPHYLTLRGLLLGELEQAQELTVFGKTDDALRDMLLKALNSTETLVAH